MSIEPVTIGNTSLRGFKAGEMELLGDNLPPILVSLRGQNGLRTKETLIQKCILCNQNIPYGQTETAMYPCVSEAQFNAFPKKVNMDAVCINLFPDIMQGEWKFLLHNPEAYDEIKTAMEALCLSVYRGIAATNVRRKIESGDGFYKPLDLVMRDDLIACFSNGKNAGKTEPSDTSVFTETEALLQNLKAGKPTLLRAK